MITMTLFGNKIVYFFIVFLFINLINQAKSIENKILVKVDNEIITTLDILNEANYLKSLNKNIQNLDKDKLFSVAKESLIREKIKKNEILNHTNKIEPNKDLINNLLKSIYTRLGLKSKKEFQNYIENFDVPISEIENKIAIETLWNELIYLKFSNKIKINKEELKKKLLMKNNKIINNYLLSEILFSISDNSEFEKKLNKIKKNIDENGFENAALINSISDSSKLGGKLGWIKENSLNIEIQKKIKNLKIGDYTDPILTPGGFLILKIDNIKIENIEIDIETELKNSIRTETNKQLNQYSNIYFKKIKKNFQINEL